MTEIPYFASFQGEARIVAKVLEFVFPTYSFAYHKRKKRIENYQFGTYRAIPNYLQHPNKLFSKYLKSSRHHDQNISKKGH